MSRIGILIRLFMLVACAVPIGNLRQAGSLLAFAPVASSPVLPPSQEDDNERSEESGKNRSAQPRLDPPKNPPAPAQRLVHLNASRPLQSIAPPAGALSVDPFRNGLGTPYRC